MRKRSIDCQRLHSREISQRGYSVEIVTGQNGRRKWEKIILKLRAKGGQTLPPRL